MKSFIGIVGSACGCILALLVLNLFIYGSDINLTAGLLLGGAFGGVAGLALCFKPTRFDNAAGNLTLGALAMTVLWGIFVCFVLVLNGLPESNQILQFVLGTLAMAGIGAVSGLSFYTARSLCW